MFNEPVLVLARVRAQTIYKFQNESHVQHIFSTKVRKQLSSFISELWYHF